MTPLDDNEDERREATGSDAGQMPVPKSIAFRTFEDLWDRNRAVNQKAAEDRLLTLFGSETVADPIKRWVTSDEPFAIPKLVAQAPFKLVPSDFLAQARRKAPQKPQATASGFAAWIYSLYSSAYGDSEDRKRGKKIEQEVLRRRRRAALCNDNEFLHGIASNWKLAYNGIQEQLDRPPDYLEAGRLHVGGVALRVSPDLVYHNAELSKVVIVEIKYSQMDIPTNLWPNIWGQLWCYSQIDLALDAQTVSVVGEVWGDEWTGRNRKRQRLVCLRASVQRNPYEPAYDRFFRELFNIYSGS